MERGPLDRVIINLRILAKVPPNSRLRTNPIFITHDQDTLQAYKRWRDHEGRVNNRRALCELTDKAIRFSEMTQHNLTLLEQLTDAMEQGQRGFRTLIETTYSNDATTKAILNRQTEKLEQQIQHNLALLQHRPMQSAPVAIPITQSPLAPTNTPTTPKRTPVPSPRTPVPSPSPSATSQSASSDESDESDNEQKEEEKDVSSSYDAANLSMSM